MAVLLRPGAAVEHSRASSGSLAGVAAATITACREREQLAAPFLSVLVPSA